MTTFATITHPATGRTAKVPTAYLPFAEKRGWTSDAGAVEVPPAVAAERPSRSATKTAWVAFAAGPGGMTVDDAEARTRDELAELFTPSDTDGT